MKKKIIKVKKIEPVDNKTINETISTKFYAMFFNTVCFELQEAGIDIPGDKKVQVKEALFNKLNNANFINSKK